MSAHINAKTNDFAKTVIMTGDPLRAKMIAENYLIDVKKVTDVRNMLGFTGSYKGKPVSVMGHGMGIPSISIYATELFREYGVDQIIRMGSCGAISNEVNLRDIIIGMGACTDSKTNRIRFGGYDFAAIADYGLLEKAVNSVRELNINVKVGNLFSSDSFYRPDPEMYKIMNKYNIYGVEMEVAGLYAVAAELSKKAIGICTVSDHVGRDEHLSADDREDSCKDIINVALNML
ncbi:purine-nucleoside phosphorylase [Dasania marina]|uniref:purine-nucleoside phosphorylase n=1 Tax=Dasania marina TaxID=471499 RepID=UPI0030D749C6|tara:strand:+ start:60692 stop:61390 length:699 start_codon:yes stop_codon:yes gene_type:complete